MRRLLTLVTALLGLLAALLALNGCTAPAAPQSTLPLAQGQPTVLFFFTDG